MQPYFTDKGYATVKEKYYYGSFIKAVVYRKQ